MPEHDYDMLVIGSGPAGQRAAIQAAKLDRRVALVERSAALGGVMINTGTIPSKTLREAALYLTGYREHGVYGESYTVKRYIKMEDLLVRTDHVMQSEIDVTRHQLMRNRVELITADASFVDAGTVLLNFADGQGQRMVTADKFVIAVGTSVTMEGEPWKEQSRGQNKGPRSVGALDAFLRPLLRDLSLSLVPPVG